MPELPEVETVVRTLRPQILGAQIHHVHVLHAKSFQAAAHIPSHILEGATITNVARRAKLIMLTLQPVYGGKLLTLAFHLKMTGKFFVHPAGTAPLKHTRIIFDITHACLQPETGTHHATHTVTTPHNGTGANTAAAPIACAAPLVAHSCAPVSARLFFDDMRTFGYGRLMWQEDLPLWPFWRQLGVEPLEVSAKEIAQTLHGHGGNIKGVLLNQTVVAGIGNIYADEALFRAGIHPQTKASALSLTRLESLGLAVQDVLQQSIEECGSSIRDYRDANGDAGSFQNNFFVYGRKGQQCLVCQNVLLCEKIAGRTTVYCSTCQCS